MEDLYKVQKKDIPKVGILLADAFQHDPLWEKVFEGESRRDQRFRAFFETPIRYCLRYGEVYAVSEKLDGIAAWVPGDLADMTFWRLIRSGAMRSGIKMGASLSRKMAPIFKQLEEDRQENMKRRPFIYLLIIGVPSKHQRQGFGGKLLLSLIDKSKRVGMPLYVETETEDNTRMYERIGFNLVKQITLQSLNLPMWEMVREPEA